MALDLLSASAASASPIRHHTNPLKRKASIESDEEYVPSAPSLSTPKDADSIHWSEAVSCPACSKRFTRKNNLDRHVRGVHLVIKNHCCTLCDRRFREKHHLESHMRVHLGLRPFACSQCDARFADRSNCIRHLTVHEGLSTVRVIGSTYKASTRKRTTSVEVPITSNNTTPLRQSSRARKLPRRDDNFVADWSESDDVGDL